MTGSMTTTLSLALMLLLSVSVRAWMSTPSLSSRMALAPRTTTMTSPSTTRLFMAENDDAILKGTVKWFDSIKGFGFISPEDGSPDIFVHQTVIQTQGFRSLADGETVEFKVELDSNGRRRAAYVTGPGGEDVQGAPFRPQNDYERY